MAQKVKKAIEDYVRANPATVKRKSDCASLIGIDARDLVRFFDGSQLLSVATVDKIATFFGVSYADAVIEHIDNIKTWYEGQR